MLFPIKDDDRGISGPCWATHLFLWSNIAVFLFQMFHPGFTYGWSAIPAEITTGTDLVDPEFFPDGNGGEVQLEHAPGPSPIQLTILSAMFMHAGFLHLGSNMLFLWIFGDNVEHRFGSKVFVLFYLVSGVIASLAHIYLDPSSTLPSLGASGAVAGVLGAYLVLFPRNRVNCVVIVFVLSLPAFVVIGLWGVAQFAGGFKALFNTAQSSGGVAYAAHVGGFVAGIVLGLLHRRFYREEPDSLLYRNYTNDPGAHPLFGKERS